MSDNRNRDYSKYDAMTTGELEEILRLDVASPNREDTDTELLLYVMGVLTNRRRNKNITGKTAQQAWESFQTNYLDEECSEVMRNSNKSRTAAPWLRRLIASAAATMLVLCIPLSTKAFDWENIWSIVAHWAKETFSFVTGEGTETTEPDIEYRGEISSLQELLAEGEHDTDIVPTWIPEGFALERLRRDATPMQEVYIAFYANEDKELLIRVQNYIATEFQKIEIEDDFSEIYSVSGTDYYIFENDQHFRAVWITDIYECIISGDISINEIKQMIDSIGKG